MDVTSVTKGQIRKLNVMKKSIGDNLGEQAFSIWLRTQTKVSVAKKDPVAEKLKAAISGLDSDSSVNLGAKGYTIKRARGRGASGFIINKNT